jgi:hypothetical protein
MLNRTIKFKDLDGNDVEKEYYFSLNKAELAEWMITAPGGDLKAHLDKLVKSKNGRQVFAELKGILTMSVAERVGNRLVKNQDVIDEFMQTPAYEALFMELMVNNGVGLLDFIRGIVPPEFAENFGDAAAVEYTDAELLAMSDAEFYAAVGRDDKKWSRQVLQVAFRRKNAA